MLLVITKLFNLSLLLGVFPTQWKRSIVVPRWKGGSRTSVDSYRGIHHTPHLSRVFERLLKERLLKHLILNNVIDERQYAFIAKRSVAGCQTAFLHHIANAHNDGQSAIILFLDIRKAFDQVPHSILLDDLRCAGVSDTLLSWFKSYLSDRTQITQIAGQYSSAVPVTSGVVQGSVLGPILFLIYINGILNCVQSGTVFLYADDVKIVYTFHTSSLQHIITQIQLDLDTISLWSKGRGLAFSTKKCQLLTFRCAVAEGTIRLQGETIPTTPNVTDLGIRYSCHLSFSNQADFQVARAKRIMFLLLRSFHLPETKVAFFKQRVRPILESCSFIASYLNHADLLKIENVQRKFTKLLLLCEPYLKYSQRCRFLKLEPLWLRRLRLNLVFLHRIIYKQVHLTAGYPNFASSTGYNLRNSEVTISYSKSRTAFHRFSFIPHYSVIWNKLPPSIRAIDNSVRFKKDLDAYLTPETAHSILSSQLATELLTEQGPPHI